MRIALSSNTFDPGFTQGQMDGIGTYSQELFLALLQQGAKVKPAYFPSANSQATLPESYALPWSYRLAVGLNLATPKRFAFNGTMDREFDLYHATDNRVPKLKKIRTLATLYDALLFTHPEWHGDAFSGIKKWLRRHTFNWADHIVTISNTSRLELMTKVGIPENKITVIYAGIAPEWFIPATAEEMHRVREKYQLPPQFLLFTGTLQHKKNLPRLVAAHGALPSDVYENFPLVVVGRAGYSAHAGAKESLAAIDKLTREKRGQWLQYVDADDLRIVFQCASLHVHPSLHEGFGLTLLQAFATQTPVLTSCVAAMPEIAGGAAYLIDPYSTYDMTEGLLALLTKDSLRAELVQQGQERVKDFSWEKCAQETLRLYTKLL